MTLNEYEHFMHIALEEARYAYSLNEVPVGAVVVKDGQVIAKAANMRETGKNGLFHAEIMAIEKACKYIGGWRLNECDMYVTLEPCPMCMGAVINTRIKMLVFGAYDTKAGACGSVLNLTEYPLNHKPEIRGGICEEDSRNLLQKFFNELREKNTHLKRQLL